MSTEKMIEKLSRIRENGNRVSESALSRMISGNKKDRSPREYDSRPAPTPSSPKSDSPAPPRPDR
jgi:hypothetical protein